MTGIQPWLHWAGQRSKQITEPSSIIELKNLAGGEHKGSYIIVKYVR